MNAVVVFLIRLLSVGGVSSSEEIPDRGLRVAGNRGPEEWIAYIPGLLSVAMLELFGLVAIQHGKPKPGKGWSLVKVQRNPWGDALLELLFAHLLEPSFLARLDEEDGEVTFGELQEILQPYFPAWQHNLKLPEPEFRDGTYS